MHIFRPELKDGVSIVRELHVYGSVVPVASRDPSKFQHQGFGTLLMEEAERIAREEHGARKISVISGTIKVSRQILTMISAGQMRICVESQIKLRLPSDFHPLNNPRKKEFLEFCAYFGISSWETDFWPVATSKKVFSNSFF